MRRFYSAENLITQFTSFFSVGFRVCTLAAGNSSHVTTDYVYINVADELMRSLLYDSKNFISKSGVTTDMKLTHK